MIYKRNKRQEIRDKSFRRTIMLTIKITIIIVLLWKTIHNVQNKNISQY